MMTSINSLKNGRGDLEVTAGGEKLKRGVVEYNYVRLLFSFEIALAPSFPLLKRVLFYPLFSVFTACFLSGAFTEH